ncbi:hypothetical protein P152DRAFT_282748 [Eremomyces bilateralis CBS 781.70]|uniref:Uncharacterized protein n=1 Tax=Eremomyces bilateralis CBS 781.70 TaxID=1392243 RepID=A0A6G1G9E4_9PEZI|nr:uncharacterized protein P152DRAFT_282748 [Eremomyces bilateralis CBS 781.70]KAF1814654.1 hypothetical protein P152DRAFT_282748 [Eremomyces bilateralis CBS 781.70]
MRGCCSVNHNIEKSMYRALRYLSKSSWNIRTSTLSSSAMNNHCHKSVYSSHRSTCLLKTSAYDDVATHSDACLELIVYLMMYNLMMDDFIIYGLKQKCRVVPGRKVDSFRGRSLNDRNQTVRRGIIEQFPSIQWYSTKAAGIKTAYWRWRFDYLHRLVVRNPPAPPGSR